MAGAPKKKKRWLLARLEDSRMAEKGVSPYGVGAVHAAFGVFCVVAFAWKLAWFGLLLLIYSSPLWVMWIAPKSIRFFWLHYVQHQFTSGPMTKGMLLEIRIPNDVPHSPKAMEFVYDALHFRPQMATKFLTHWRGHVRPWYSFEIVSMKNELKFYVWCWERLRPQVEAAFYAQYPTIQLIPVAEDYAETYIKKHGGPLKLNCWGNAMMLEKGDAYPIRTYFDYELDKDPKSEHKHDPFVTILEQLSSTAHDEVLWLQIMFQPEWTSAWKKEVFKEIKKLYDKTRKPFKNAKGEEQPGYAQLKPMQYEVVRAMERSTTKLGFYVSIRGVTIFEGKYNNMMTQTLNQLFRPIGSGGSEFFNFIKLDPIKHTSGFDYPWEFREWRRPARVKKMLDAYVARSAFAPPHIEDPFILTSEELATVFHIPGAEAKALGIKRIDSFQKGPPPNLPV